MKKAKKSVIVSAILIFVILVTALIIWNISQPKTGPSAMSFIKAEVVSSNETSALVRAFEDYDNLRGGGLKELDKGTEITIKVLNGTYDDTQLAEGNKKLSELVAGDIVSIMSTEINDNYVVDDWQATVVK